MRHMNRETREKNTSQEITIELTTVCHFERGNGVDAGDSRWTWATRKRLTRNQMKDRAMMT
jgi:hypothetical protein